MNLNGASVQHKKYGQGVIQEIGGDYVFIEFNEEIKKFTYPNAFKLGLKAVDKDVELFINNEIKRLEVEASASQILENEKIEANNILEYEFLKANDVKYFFVFQNKSFKAERSGGYLWAPKLNAAGGKESSWVMMEEVRKGDIIVHSVSKNIVAISVATSDCYSANQPQELKREQLWQDDGYMVDCKYIDIKNPIVTSDYKDEILKLQPSVYAPFNNLGRGNTGYLFASNRELTGFIIEKSVKANPYLNEFKSVFE